MYSAEIFVSSADEEYLRPEGCCAIAWVLATTLPREATMSCCARVIFDGATFVMLAPPGGGTTVELSSFAQPAYEPGNPAAMANELGLRSIAFEVEDLRAAVDRLGAAGYGLIGGIGEWEGVWAMAYVRGPDGITVALAQRLG